MTPTEAHQVILAKIADDWNVATAVVLYPGERTTPPTDAPFIRVSFRARPIGPVTHGAVGQRLAEQRGRMFVQAFAPNHEDDGEGASRVLAEAFRDVLHGKSFGVDPVHFDVATIDPIGVDGALYQTNVELTYRYHERI